MEAWIVHMTGGIIDQFQVSVVLRLFLAAICGGIIGFERGIKGRPAGIKTFSLVCIGAALAMVTNEYISVYLMHGTGDAARMAAQVISGIGFLGAGTIMVTGTDRIKGLTTAAALWLTAALGITIGTGFYFGAFAGLLIVCSFSLVYVMLDRAILSNSRYMKLCVEGVDEEAMMRLLDYLEEKDIKIQNLVRRSEFKWRKKDICTIMELDFRKHKKHKAVLEELKKIEGIRFLYEI